MNDERRPATSAPPTTSTKSKSISGKRHVARSAGTNYGKAALASALEDLAEVTERSHGLFRISASMGNLIASGQLNESYVTAALLDVARDRGMDLRKAERTMQRGIDRGRATPRSPKRAAIYSRNDATVALVEWCEAVGRGEWTERSSATDLRVLTGFGLIAKKVGKLRFSASHRQIAEEAGVSVSSVRCALRRCLHGYVFRVNYGNRVQGTASKWQLVTKRARTNDHSLSLGEEKRLVAGARALDLPDHAQWDRWPNGWRVYNLLQSDEGMTVSVISEVTGRPPGSVRRILNVLRDRQLARRHESGEWTALLPAEDGVDGTRTRRARERRHRDERKLWANSRSVLIGKKNRPMSAKWRDQPDLFSVPRARWNNPATSKAAAASIPIKSITQTQERVLALLRIHGPLSDEELEEIFQDCWPNSASPQGIRSRRGELVRKGRVVDSGRRSTTKYGRGCVVWRLTS